MKTTLLSLVLAATVATTLACNKSQASPSGDTAQPSTAPQGGKVYETRGVIKAFGEGKKSVKISHEDVPGFMKAMTMPFNVSSLSGSTRSPTTGSSFSPKATATRFSRECDPTVMLVVPREHVK